MKFRITDKNITSYEDDGLLHIVGIANTGRKDLVGDVLTEEALCDICEQAINHNLHLDHDTSMEGLLGPITDAKLVEEGVEIHATIVNTEKAGYIKTLLENGVKLGLSVNGIATNTSTDKHTITEWDLTEISITPLPCDQGTMGSVCIAKSFAEVIQKNKETMEEKSMAEDLTIEKVIDIINEAFNERREEYLETIREDFKTEYDAKIKELEERVDRLTKELETRDAFVNIPAPEQKEDEKDGAVEGAEEGKDATIVEGEGEVSTEAKSVPEEIEETEGEVEATEEEETEGEEEDGGDVLKHIEEVITKKFDEIFTNKKNADLDFKYKEEEQKNIAEETEEEHVVKKAYTPHELAQLLSKQ